MAASKAPTTAASVSSTTSALTNKNNNTSLTLLNDASATDICHNFHELCRSCGKTNDQLYDLFQNEHLNSSTNNSNNSPFTTSSTTCYTHLNNSCSTASCSSSSSSSLLSATNKLSFKAVGSNTNSTTAALNFDTVAATAKATAKGQSNMDNILQEMQIWQLMIKCNDGLPQRICAKCTAQFYMIHKFRRKCLKVQTQLRALNEEQKIYERQQQQQQKEKIATATETETETVAKIEPAQLLAKAVKASVMLHENKDLVNDNSGEQQQQQQQQQQEQQQKQYPEQAALIQTKSSSSVSFETIAGNTKDCKAATLLVDVVAKETKPQKIEFQETTPTSCALAVNDKICETHEQGTLKLKLKDEKKPLLKAAVLNSIKSSALTLQQPLEQICDNEANDDDDDDDDHVDDDALSNRSEKCCLDQMDLLSAHVIFKTCPNKTKDLKSCSDQEKELKENLSTKTKQNATNLTKDCAFTENLFLTKAALKAYTIPPTTTTAAATNLEARHNNDNNNNAHLCDNRVELNDSTCSSTSSSPAISSSSSSSSSSSFKTSSKSTKPFRTKGLRHKIVKYATCSKRPGYCSKSKQTIPKQTKMIAKRKQRSWKNKHKLKRLNAMRTYSLSEAQKLQSLQIKDEDEEEEETSSTVSATSSPSSSTTSSSSNTTTTTTTPAVSNLLKMQRYNVQSSQSENSNQTGGCPSLEGISSNRSSSIMWKTKAAMKANANDMPKDPVVVQHYVEPLSNVTATAIISLPYKASTPPPPPAQTLTGSPCLAAETDTTSSKTLNENQSISSRCSSNNNILMDDYGLANKALTSPDNQVKDIEDESLPKPNNTVWPEEAGQKQIKANKQIDNAINEQDTKETNKTEVQQKDEASQKPIISTPPVKTGGMKLIIQRKRGERFRCRRKEDDEESTNIPDSVEPSTPKRRRKTTSTNLKYKFEMESLFFIKHTGDKDSMQENDEQPINITDISGKNNIITKDSKIVPEFQSEEDENKENPRHDFDSDSNVSVSYRDPLLIRNEMLEDDTHLTDFPKPQLSLQTECSKEMYKLYREKINLESPKKLIVRVPLISLTQDFKRMHLSMDSEENQDVDRDQEQDCEEEKEGDNEQEHKQDQKEEDHEQDQEKNHEQDKEEDHEGDKEEDHEQDKEEEDEQRNQENDHDQTHEDYEQNPEEDHERDHEEECQYEEDKQNEFQNLNSLEENQNPPTTTEQESNQPTFCLQNFIEKPAVTNNESSSPQSYITSSQSDLLGFSQTSEASSSTVDSSPNSIEMMRYVEPPQCSASSKINDFINDFQNNCIDSSEIEDTCDMIPHLRPQINQELSDEIRDVEDTLNGILSEMHDKDMYTPRSGETDEFFPHSTYSPLTDSPTTPSQSFYAESPCTINSNPMSVSPFIHHNMDYNAMTPQSNHSSMGYSSYIGSSCHGGGGSTGSHTGVYSEHYPSYNECFEETTQSELIGFQNDIPCFENIEMSNNQANNGDFVETQEEDPQVSAAANTNNFAQNINEAHKPAAEIVDYIDLSDYKEEGQTNQEQETQQQAGSADILPQQISYHPNYHPSIQLPNSTNSLNTQPHYIVTNTNQGPIIIANPHINSSATERIDGNFKPHNNNLQFVTLGQAMEASNPSTPNHVTEFNWPTPNRYHSQPVINTSNGTTTYFINANGELYQANIPSTTLQNPSLNTILVPTANTNQTNNNKFVQQQQHQVPAPHSQNPNNGQYIMLVNNLGATPQYYAATQATNLNPSPTSAVLFHNNQNQQQVQNGISYRTDSANESNCSSSSSSSSSATNSSKATHVPIIPAPDTATEHTSSSQTVHQRVNHQLQKQIKQRQLQSLQPRSPNVTQKITLVCRFCHKRPKFTNNVDYSNHIINTHPAEKPYNCPQCPMHFTRRFERQQHVAQVHGSRYQCAQCGLSFCAQRTLDFHLQKYHANLGRTQLHLQPHNSTSTTSTSSSSSTSTSSSSSSSPPSTAAATYQLLQHNKQQRLVRVEDVHVQVTGENKNKRSIDLTLDGDADIQTSQSMSEVNLSSAPSDSRQQQQTRKLCCPDCNGDNDDCCGSNRTHDQQNNSNLQQQQQYAGNESVNNHHHQQQQQQQQQHHSQHITIPSPEQTEPDSTTTLRHFRKRQLSEIPPHFVTSPSSSSSSSSSTSSSLNNNINHASNNNDITNHNSPDNNTASAGGGGNGGKQIVVERSLRATHNCLLCEDSFTNEIALRKHHHLAHGATTAQSSTVNMALVCQICKRAFRMRTALQRHMETHDAEGRPYECNICQVRFPRPSQLTLHKLTVHKFEKPISCEECGKQFGTESAMKEHAKEHDKAASLTTATSASDTFSTSATSSSSASSQPPQVSSRIYLETMTTKTSTITTEQNINLQTTTSGEDTSSSITSASALITANHNTATATATATQYNIVTQNTIVSGLNT